MENAARKSEDETKQLAVRIKKLETRVERLEAECERFRRRAGLAEEELGKTLAEAGRYSTPEMNNLEALLLSFSDEWLADYAEEYHLFQDEKESRAKGVHQIAAHMLVPDNMRNALLQFDEETLDAFERLIAGGCVKPAAADVEKLDDLWDEGFVNYYEDETYEVPPDVRVIYGYICKVGYRDYHRHMRWLERCLEALEWIYAAAPVKILHRMYRKDTELSLPYQDFLQLLDQFPEDRNPCRYVEGNLISKEYASFCSFQYFDDKMFATDYYIPTKEEILDYAKNGYPARQKEYQELWNFANTVMKMTPDNSSRMCMTIMQDIFQAGVLESIRNLTIEAHIHAASMDIAKHFSDLVKKVNANTRMAFLRGHTLREMRDMSLLPAVGVTPIITRQGKDIQVVLMNARTC
ncbi:MAG: hypothetical protein LUG93_05520 [Lachnospiraceae bacterium]|nr:hypothetical protein [Lachnospiraceae bacterium]